MKFYRSDFANYIFQPYNSAVYEDCGYQKTDYKLWRKLRDWLYDDEWREWTIRVQKTDEGWEVYPLREWYITPEILLFTKDDGALGQYMTDHETEFLAFGLDVRKALEEHQRNNSFCVNNDCSCAIGASSYTSTSYDISSDNIYIDGVSLQEHIEKIIKVVNNDEEKENNETMRFSNFDFGPVDASVRMSLYGMAIKNASGVYVAYDAASKQVMDVDILNFEGTNKFIYKMPAAIGDVKTGDVVIHARRPMFVQEVKPDNRLVVMDIYDGEEKTIVLSKSPFGFDFVTKVVSLVNFAGAATEGNPFGNMLPFLLMSDNKGDSDMLLPLLMMSQNGGAMNPLMMYALMSKDSKANDMLPFLLMSGNTGCGCNCGCNKE